MTSYALLIIDMQKAYFRNDALRATRDEVVGRINELTEWAERSKIPVYTILTEHARDRSTWTLNMLDDGEGYLFAGDTDAELVEGLRLDGAAVERKTRDSAFFETGLAATLRARGVDTLILAGVSTHGCVFQTAADAYAENFRVILAGQAIASHDPRFHTEILELLGQEYRQKCLNNDELLQLLGA